MASSTSTSTSASPTTYWTPASLLIDDDDPSTHPSPNRFAVLVLNQPIRNVTVFLTVCSRAQTIIAVDGGANRIKDLYLNESRLKTCMPHAIVGDMDSLRDDVRTYFASQGVKIQPHIDVDCTDFEKGLRYVHESFSGRPAPPLDIAAFGGLGGRADHAFAQVNDLWRESLRRQPGEGRLFLLTAESLMFVLETGNNTIQAPRTPKTFDESVGIVPVGHPAVIHTRGLEWDVRDYETRFGGNVSTSNHLRSETVEIRTDRQVLFTMEFALKPHP